MTTDARSRQRGSGLPAEATSFVGRRKEVAEAKRLLAAGRLLTLTGVGGVGKTRLALRVAAGARRAFVDGVWLVELAALLDGTLLEQTVADTVGLRDQSARSPREAVLGYLRDKQLLLVLDNCEHLTDRCAALAAALLPVAPGLRILATSRQSLGAAGEHLMEVSPLPLPDPDHPAPRGKLNGDEAIRLFEERAKLLLPDFGVTDDNRAVVAQICRRLDGVPLAIELAAARVRVLSPEQILHRLDDRFRFLRAGRRVGPARHQTLRAVADWSHELCSPSEQTLWARVSVFAGGFDLDAAEAVCAGDGVELDRVLDLVAGLVDKSILIREDRGPRMRYRMLDTIAHFGREALLASGQETVLRRRHRDYYLGLAERGAAEWLGPDQRDVADRTRREHANLRLALEFCLDTPGESQQGLRLAAALQFYWHCGFLAEGRLWLKRVLTQEAEPTLAWATALQVEASLAIAQGDLAVAAAKAKECREWAQPRGEETTLAYALAIQGAVAQFSGDLPRAQVLLEDALARFTALGELTVTAIMIYAAPVTLSVYQGDLEGAVAYAQRARALCEQHGEQWARAYTLYALSLPEWKQGRLSQARTHARESLRILHSFDDLFGTALAIERLACIFGAEGADERVAVLLGAAGMLWPLVGGQPLYGSRRGLAAHEECELQARRTLGERGFQAAFDRGAGFDIGQAVAYALDEHAILARAEVPADTARTSLTRREQEVAELVAQGLSNKDIAARLVISRRTAEGHVERILAKLGFTKRIQLATWTIRQEEGRNP